METWYSVYGVLLADRVDNHPPHLSCQSPALVKASLAEPFFDTQAEGCHSSVAFQHQTPIRINGYLWVKKEKQSIPPRPPPLSQCAIITLWLLSFFKSCAPLAQTQLNGLAIVRKTLHDMVVDIQMQSKGNPAGTHPSRRKGQVGRGCGIESLLKRDEPRCLSPAPGLQWSLRSLVSG